MMTLRQSDRHTRRTSRQVLLEFFALTFLVVAVAFTAGMVIRKSQLERRDTGEVVSLMRVDRLERAAAVPQTRHQLVPAAEPASLRETPSPAPVPALEPVSVPTPVAAPAPVAAEPIAAPAPATAPRPAVAQPDDTRPTFNGRPLRKARTIRMLVTAYSPDERSCGIWADGITASGYSVWTNGMKLVAADKKLFPFGAVLSIPGYNGGQPVPVLDRGGAIKGKRLDVLYPTHEVALQWGKQWLDVTVWEYADE